ncbi:MAG: (5-formylfuran-3-yl)methyl phosphate synthase, partial [Planctomycetaceae bacterium]
DGECVPALPSELNFLKLGPAGLARTTDWIDRWQSVREAFDQQSRGVSARPSRWIAVAYADFREADAPQPAAILDAAAATGCGGVLIDTFTKSDHHLLDWLSVEELRSLVDRAHRHDLPIALAGRLRADLLPSFAGLRPDILAIRTAACRHGDRHGPVSADAVREFKAAIAATFQ